MFTPAKVLLSSEKKREGFPKVEGEIPIPDYGERLRPQGERLRPQGERLRPQGERLRPQG